MESASGGPRCVTCKCEESYSIKCPRTPNPTTICGTNNKTYKDYCSLREEVCKVKAFIDVEHIGSCIGKLTHPVVQRVDNAINRINHYPVDSVVCFVNTYPLDSDLSGG